MEIHQQSVSMMLFLLIAVPYHIFHMTPVVTYLFFRHLQKHILNFASAEAGGCCTIDVGIDNVSSIFFAFRKG